MRQKRALFVIYVCIVNFRGENHPGGWLFAEKEGHHDQTDFVMLVNTDLKVCGRSNSACAYANVGKHGP